MDQFSTITLSKAQRLFMLSSRRRQSAVAEGDATIFPLRHGALRSCSSLFTFLHRRPVVLFTMHELDAVLSVLRHSPACLDHQQLILSYHPRSLY